MAAIATPTLRKDGVSIDGKRVTELTFGAASSTNTYAVVGSGLARVREVWLRIDGTTLMTALTGAGLATLTWDATTPAGRYRLVGE